MPSIDGFVCNQPSLVECVLFCIQCKLIKATLMLPDRFPVFHVDLDIDFQSSDNVFPPFPTQTSQQPDLLQRQSNVTVFSTIGQRKDNLDRFNLVVRKQYTLLAVFDGHSDPAPVNYVHATLTKNIQDHPRLMSDPSSALMECFQQTQRQVIQKFEKGCTALVGLVINGRLIVANLGDSKLLGVDKTGKVKDLTSVHNLSNKSELMQVINRGGIVLKKGNQYRINGQLNLSRCFGDKKLKNCLSSRPDLYEFQVESFAKWVLATDGFYNAEKCGQSMSSQDYSKLEGHRELYKDNATAIFYHS